MIKSYHTVIAKISVLRSAQRLYQNSMSDSRFDQENRINTEPLLGDQKLKFCYIGGTIPREDQLRFKRLLYRATRGKVFTKFFDMEIPITD